MTASTLYEALQTFNLRPLQSQAEMNRYYVDYTPKLLKRLAVILDANYPYKVLFTGHRVTGKSTALNQLSFRLRSTFFIVHLAIPAILDIFDVDYTDFMLALSARLFLTATDQKYFPRGLHALVKDDLLGDIVQWLDERVRGLNFAPLSETLTLNAQLHLLAGQLEAKISTETRTRQEMRERIFHHISELIDRMNYVIGEIERKSEKRVLFIVEDVDKLDIEPARRLFLGNARTLTAPRSSIIYTFPNALRYSTDFPQINNNFDQHFIWPIVRIEEKDGAPATEGRRILEEVFYKRIRRDLVEQDALDALITASGGLIGMLIRLGLLAAEHALIDDKNRIDLESASRAIAEVRGDYKAILRSHDYDVLGRSLAGEELNNDANVQELLYSSALVEYHNHEPWIRVHPIVRELVRNRLS